jgi:hypothetical protein
MLTSAATVFFLTVALQTQSGETKKIPDDSLEITATGCLKGRVFTATGRDERDPEVEVKRGPDVTGRSFRLAGKKQVMDEVKKHNGRFVEVVGLIRKAALEDYTPGLKVGNSRVVIGAPSSSASSPGGIHAEIGSSPGIPVMDATSVRFLGESCPIDKR